MKKFLITIAFALMTTTSMATPFLHVATPMTSIVDVKVFHNNTAVDNGDSCYTPEEIAGQRSVNFEKIAAYVGADADKFKQGVLKVYPDLKLEQLTWVEIDGYKFVAPDGKVMVLMTLFGKDDKSENVCAVGGGPVSIEDWNKVVIAAGLAPVATQIHLGFEPKVAPKTLAERGNN